MRIFRTCTEAVSEVTRDLYEMGVRVHPETMQNKKVAEDSDYNTLELMGYSYMVQGPFTYSDVRNAVDSNVGPKGMDYCVNEFSDRISQDILNPGISHQFRMEVWEEFLDEDGKFDYTYNERLGHDNIGRVIQLLRKNPNSRQGVVPIYFKHVDDKLRGGIKRIPCSMHYQFMLRNGELNVIYVMRSCDIHTHLPIDMALAIMMLQHVAHGIGAKQGNFIHQIGSLHIYSKDARPGVF